MEVPGEMDTVLQVAGGQKEALDFLGCYYALQFLHMNLRMVDIVKLELATSRERAQTSKKFMLEAGRMFRYLTKSYMERLLDIFLEGKSVPEFVVLGVGTRSDQDDIDLGVVDYGERIRKPLNKAMFVRCLITDTHLQMALALKEILMQQKGFFSQIKSDFPASIVVFFVALPLCLGIALASGAPLFSGRSGRVRCFC